jgi:opacity protein-like surface antigen
MLKKLILFIPAIAFCFPAFAAIPQASGIYGELNAGYGKVDESIRNSHQNDNDGFGASAFLGYKFNPYLGIEGGYTEYPYEDFDNNIKGSENFAVDLALKGILPLGNTGLSIFIKGGGAGVHHKLADGTVQVSGAGTHFEPAVFAGFGVDFAILKNLSVNLQATGTTKKSNVPSMYLFSGGITYILPESVYK